VLKALKIEGLIFLYEYVYGCFNLYMNKDDIVNVGFMISNFSCSSSLDTKMHDFLYF